VHITAVPAALTVPPILLVNPAAAVPVIVTVSVPSPTTTIGEPAGQAVGGAGAVAAVAAHSPVSLQVTCSPAGIESVLSVIRQSSTPNITVAGVPAGHGVLGPDGVRPNDAKF